MTPQCHDIVHLRNEVGRLTAKLQSAQSVMQRQYTQRDRLQARIHELEAEVTKLKAREEARR